MKKILSIFVAVIMMFSCFTGVFSAFAADGSKIEDIIGDMTNMENFQNALIGSDVGFDYSADGQEDIIDMIENGMISGEVYGMSIDEFYTGTSPINWSSLPIDKGDLALAIANVNNYIMRILKEKVGGFNLYSMQMSRHGMSYASYYATSIANFLGNLFYPDFEDVVINFDGYEQISEDEFYTQIVRQSGFGVLLDNNWCDQGRFDIRPLMETLGLLSDNVLESEYSNGYILGRKLVKAVIEKIIYDGPVNAFLDILQAFSKSYNFYLKDAVVALFSNRLAAGEIELSELDNLHELFNIIFNGNNPEATDKLQFVQMPAARFAKAEGVTELFLYFIVYSVININYKNNNAVVENMKSKVNNLDITNEEKDVLKCVLDAVFKGDVNSLATKIGSIFSTNVDSIKDDFLSSLKNALASFFKKIVDYFDNLFKILSGEKEPPRWDIEDRDP
ncbi:MAG: hypothetical protein IKJ27_04390 [Clostridia bacterium]|nr:hypothetical protein [Clostridia bacterium]